MIRQTVLPVQVRKDRGKSHGEEWACPVCGIYERDEAGRISGSAYAQSWVREGI